MPIMNLIRDNWCRFQGELFPEIQDAVGPLFKKYQGFVMALEIGPVRTKASKTARRIVGVI